MSAIVLTADAVERLDDVPAGVLKLVYGGEELFRHRMQTPDRKREWSVYAAAGTAWGDVYDAIFTAMREGWV